MANETDDAQMKALQAEIKRLFSSGNLSAMRVPSPAPKGASNQEAAKASAKAIEHIRHFDLRPRDLRDYLNRYVIRQEAAKKVLSVAICDHYHHARRCLEEPSLIEQDYHKQNILLLGPTGVGKTFLMRKIAQKIGVPFVKADATKFSETGYVGADVEDLVRDLLKAAGGDVKLAQFGIVYLDEVDKIASKGSEIGKDVSGRGVQVNLLKLMEDTDVSPFAPQDMMGQMRAMMSGLGGGGEDSPRRINTRHILFILSGAFDKLAESIERRLKATAIGFGAPVSGGQLPHELLAQAETKDFINYGFEPEFIGRVPVRVSCEALSEGDLARILSHSESSLLRQYEADFSHYGITFSCTPEAILAVAHRANAEGTGARGLMTVLERTLREAKFELPSTGITRFELTSDFVENPHRALSELLSANAHLSQISWQTEIEAFAAAFQREHGLTLTFTPEASALLAAMAREADTTLRSLCEHHFKDFPHGLAIIQRNTGQESFTLTETAAREPDAELSRWVVASFRPS